MKPSCRLLAVVCCGIGFLGPLLIAPISSPPEAQQEYDNGMVVSVSAPGSEAGLSMLVIWQAYFFAFRRDPKVQG